MVIVRYQGNPEEDHINYGLVGKGVTFDTGGLHVKPYGFMEDMYIDKGGACAVLGALKGTVDMNLPINAVFAFGLVENAIGSKSYKPGDIITGGNGTSVEIMNTDAEGRLVLADVLHHV